MRPNDLARIARQSRLRDLQAVFAAGAGHIGGEMSAMDILTALYVRVLRIWPDQPRNPDRDRFVLSKGHVALALYVTLARRGFMPEDDIATVLKPPSRLNGHPDCTKVPGGETNTGPWGHGLPVAVGVAKAAKITGAAYHTYAMTGDGEMQEGSTWEAISAAAQFGLGNLTLIIDHNRFQQGAALRDTSTLAPFGPKLAAFGWQVTEIDGHDMAEIVPALEAWFDRPHAIVAPCDAIETAAAVTWAAGHDGPAFLRLARVGLPDLLPPGHRFVPGRADLLRDGDAVTLIANGTLTHRMLKAADLLAAAGIFARVLNMATVRPIDVDAVVAAVRDTGAILTAEEHLTFGGLGSAIAEVVVEKSPAPMKILGVPGIFAPTGSAEFLLDEFGMSPAASATAAKALTGRKAGRA